MSIIIALKYCCLLISSFSFSGYPSTNIMISITIDKTASNKMYNLEFEQAASFHQVFSVLSEFPVFYFKSSNLFEMKDNSRKQKKNS